VSSVLPLYADLVDFYGKPFDHQMIREDKARYFRRWPEIHHTLIGDVEIEHQATVTILRFPIQYDTHNRERGDTKSGTAIGTLAVRRLGNEWKIVGESQSGYVRE
jgi:hypothetical protein